MALPLRNRLRLARDFRAVYSSHRSAKEGKLLLKARASDKKTSRFGVVISKAVAKKAVERNRMRRLLTEALETSKDSLHKPYDIAIIGISGIAAFIMLIWGGIQWMSSAGNPTAISDAKDRIQKALLGLLLVLSSFIIIQIINPELTILQSPFP